jgi:hypothetical protein
VEQSRWERALHETKGLGNWRRDVPLLVGVVALTFAGLTVLGSGDVGTNAVSALLVGFGVLVVLPLLELFRNYLKAPEAPVEAELPRSDEEEERYRSLSERLGGDQPPQEGSHSE